MQEYCRIRCARNSTVVAGDRIGNESLIVLEVIYLKFNTCGFLSKWASDIYRTESEHCTTTYNYYFCAVESDWIIILQNHHANKWHNLFDAGCLSELLNSINLLIYNLHQVQAAYFIELLRLLAIVWFYWVALALIPYFSSDSYLEEHKRNNN